MFDFWESMGRVVGNEDNLRTVLLADSVLTAKNLREVCAQTSAPFGIYWQIASAKYDKLNKILVGHMAFLPVSVFAQGEWLRVLPFLTAADFTKIDQAIQNLGISLKGRTPEFYAGLGAITVDDRFAGAVAADPQKSFPILRLEKDRTDLKKIASDVNGYAAAAVGFCAKNWEPPCFVLAKPYNTTAQIQPALSIGLVVNVERDQKQ